MRRRLVYIIPAATLGMILFAALGGQIVKWLWNALLPPLFGLPIVTFWQAIGLLALSRILFGGFGCPGRRSYYSRMTDEERERMRQRIRERLGIAGRDGERAAP